jgi:hypothetical protein
MSNLSRKRSSDVSSSLPRVVLVAGASCLLVVAIFILVSAVASPISRGSGTSSAPATKTVPATAISTASPTPPLGAPTPLNLLEILLGGAVVVFVVLILLTARERDKE